MPYRCRVGLLVAICLLLQQASGAAVVSGATASTSLCMGREGATLKADRPSDACRSAIAGDDAFGGMALLQRDAGRRLREAFPDTPFPFAPALGRDATALAEEAVNGATAEADYSAGAASATAPSAEALAMPFPFKPALGPDALDLAVEEEARLADDQSGLSGAAPFVERSADEVQDVLRQRIAVLSEEKVASQENAEEYPLVSHHGSDLLSQAVGADLDVVAGAAPVSMQQRSQKHQQEHQQQQRQQQQQRGAAMHRNVASVAAAEKASSVISARFVARTSSTSDVGRETRKLLPTLLIAGLSCTMLILIALIIHQRLVQQVPGIAGRRLETAMTRSLSNTPVGSARQVGAVSSSRNLKASESVLMEELVVPPGKRMVCLLERRLYNEPQELVFDITSGHHRGRSPLMKVRVSETTKDRCPNVGLEYLSGESLTFFTTQELWEERPNSELGRQVSVALYGPSGAIFGQICRVPTERGVMYQVFKDHMRIDSPLYTFSGDFATHSIRVTECGPLGRLVASCEPSQAGDDEDVMQVKIEPLMDAGIVLLGLLAIDKIQRSRV